MHINRLDPQVQPIFSVLRIVAISAPRPIKETALNQHPQTTQPTTDERGKPWPCKCGALIGHVKDGVLYTPHGNYYGDGFPFCDNPHCLAGGRKWHGKPYGYVPDWLLRDRMRRKCRDAELSDALTEAQK